ncbi:hypothetical protein SDC9_76201 [bioreactor metagenome]|uniref:Uncharacterized protein n=1 Tax=bioreactor metagenome TaxID=1076179 RepID=A0A644YP63_9ZZZZ
MAYGDSPNKREVKPRVVGDQCGVPRKLEKCNNCLPLLGCALDHCVCDSGQGRDLSRNRPLRVDKRIEGFYDFSLANAHSADFGQPVARRIESRRLHVENDKLTLKRKFFSGSAAVIVYKVALNAVQDFDFMFFGGGIRLRKSLNDAVIGNGNSPMSPRCRPLDIVCHRCDGVKGRHVGM